MSKEKPTTIISISKSRHEEINKIRGHMFGYRESIEYIIEDIPAKFIKKILDKRWKNRI